YDRKLDSKIAGSVVSINAFKGVEFGIGFQAAKMNGSDVHDEIVWNEEDGYHRSTNRLGGFEGGMTTGMPIVVKGIMKPIPNLKIANWTVKLQGVLSVLMPLKVLNSELAFKLQR